ncbi:Wzz/FepE/Etk N-terminal domain-containing protein [Bradyrhizobium sp. CB82]|uniref:Wzz/FepE/Etk N-terminal domain-containing protein n=1 Tax=Bradyrhizobium sp. CB82 TaxID=3039159 RepID=UPI0024B1676F|nr:Wzz/FepE/Etk N-terminal domain-containing protein [Bradyrhizobium sp. CB82]WFU38832.1 Wzz/FepE/Etk N-terminal domain-containing protein [Bradyrhizobium sp. CB82]
MAPDHRLPVVSVADVADFLWRRVSIISLTCLAMWGIAVLYLIVATPKFTAEADLVIESKAPLGDTASVSTIVESQIGIIKSESIARDVIRKLDLAKDPEFAGQIGIRNSIARLLGWRKPETEAIAIRYALEVFQRKLSVKRVGLTYLVEVSFESIDAERAAQILNTVAETYIGRQMDAKYKSTFRDETWIKDRLNELTNQASSAQKALEDYYKNRKDMADSADAVDPGAARSQSTTRRQGELRELVAAAEQSTSALDNFRHALRQMDAVQQQSLPVFEARLITEALPPLRASSPKGLVVLGISTVAGLFLGIAIGILRDLSYRGIRTSGQVWRELQVPCIAVVPKVKPQAAWRKLTTVLSDLAEKRPVNLGSLHSQISSMRIGPQSVVTPALDAERRAKRALSSPPSPSRPKSRSIVRAESPIWTITDAPESRFTESFLEIKLAIDSTNRSGKRKQVIGITSTQAAAGTSTVAAALALLLAHAGSRVVLVDCNLRNRSLSTALAPTATFGILDVMAGAASVSETTWTDAASQLVFLPVGNDSRTPYASDILGSEKLDRLLQSLRETYEYVIVDLPPLAPFADVRAAAHLLDSFILVVEWGRTKVSVVARALEACNSMDDLMLGITLNKADLNY